MQTALRNILNVVQGDSVSETSDRIDEPLDAAVDEELDEELDAAMDKELDAAVDKELDAAVDKELDNGPQISLEENSFVEILEDGSPDVSNFEEIELPAIDEGVDLDAFWDDALAEELGGDQSGKGLGFDEARDNGLLPPEFEPGRKTRD